MHTGRFEHTGQAPRQYDQLHLARSRVQLHRRIDAWGYGGKAMNWLLVAILGYVLVQFAIGTWVSRRMASETDYILAGRRLGVGLVTFSVFATYFGAEAIVASGGAVYEKGLSGALVDPVGYATAIIIVGVFFARALWSRGLTTFADLFRQRYSPGVEQLVVIVLLPGSVIWAAAQVRAFGQVMSANSGIGLVSAITLAAVLVAAYSVVGGLLADAVTDVIQGIAVVVGLIILGAIVAVHVGGVSAGLAQVEPRTAEAARRAGRALLAYARATGDPDLRHHRCGRVDLPLPRRAHGRGRRKRHGPRWRHLPDRRPDSRVSRARGSAAYCRNVPDAEQIVPRLAEVYLPGVLYVAFVGAIISAILSAVHAALHAPASQISHNIVVRLIPGITDRGKLWCVRLTVMALSIVAYLLSVTSAAHSRSGRDGIGVRQRRRVRDGAVCALHPLRRAGQRLRLGGGGHARLGGRQVRARPDRALPARAVGGPRRLRRRGAAGRAA